MKKFVVSAAVFGIFLIYTVGIRHQAPVLSKPTSLKQYKSTSTASAASTSSGSSTASSQASSTGSSTSSGQYKDGYYVGSSVNAYYGNVQAAVTIKGGKISNVKFLQYPNTHSTSVIINQQAMPYLKQETLQSQNANNVQIISGATFTSQAYLQSLQSALNKA